MRREWSCWRWEKEEKVKRFDFVGERKEFWGGGRVGRDVWEEVVI